ncbi:MAG TPA: RNA polymerase sigma factor [Verrucomicrobiae bacterium]
MLENWFGMTDEQAMWRVQMHDDPQAFAQLVQRWEGPIQRLCTRMLSDEHKAEDATQEAFAKVYAKRKEFQHGSKFSTFLWRVATNLCLDELRRVKRRKEFQVFPQTVDSSETEVWEELPSESPGPADSTVAEEQAVAIRHAVNQLPEHYRSVIILRHYQDLKFREIAQVLEVPEGTVKSRMAEALMLLNQSLKKTLSDDPPAGPVRPIGKTGKTGNTGKAIDATKFFNPRPASPRFEKEVLV